MPEEPAFTLELTSEARDDLQRIDKSDAERIIKKLRWLAADAAQIKHEALTG